MRSLPIRVRLTLWYSLAITVTMFTIGLVSLWMVHHAIDNLEKIELQERVRGVRRFIESRTAANGCKLSTSRATGSTAHRTSPPSIPSWRFPRRRPTPVITSLITPSLLWFAR